MEVKIQCECGTRFAFDVEPLNGRMPVRVKCPECGADQTEQANEMIRQKLAEATGPAVVAAPVPTPAAAPVPASQPMRTAVPPMPAAEAPVATATVTFCFRHLKKPAVETCRVCGKPICGECMEQYGYACSVYCRKRAEETGMDLPVYAKQRAVIEARISRVAAWIWRTAVFLGVVLLGVWIWYAFFASHPRVIYSEKLLPGDRARFYKFLVPDQVLLIKASQMNLFDVSQQKQLWSVPLDVKVPPSLQSNLSIITNAEEEAGIYFRAGVLATTNDLWVFYPGRLVQYDRHSGNSKQEIPLKPPYFNVATNDNGMTVISASESSHPIITRIKFADGSVQTEPIESAKVSLLDRQPESASAALSTNSPGYAKLAKIAALAKQVMMGKADKPAEQTNWDDKFMPDGDGVVQLKVDLLERKTIMRQAMKQQKKSLLDDNLTAGQSLEAVEREMNEAHRTQTGGVEEEDVSRFHVTLHRLPTGSAPDWRGETVGEPSLFTLKTLNLLVARDVIQVFDKNNRKLWGAHLTYPVKPTDNPPGIEAGNALYVFDQGMLTRFDAATGTVRWRLTSVGISQVQLDGKENLYVSSTTASPDTIQFSQQVDLSAKASPVVLKVDAATGKVLWRTENIGNQCFVSGKYVYIAQAAQSPLTTVGEDPILYFDLYRLSPSDGHPMWDYSQSRHPVQIEVQGNEILLHFKGELQVLKFLSL